LYKLLDLVDSIPVEPESWPHVGFVSSDRTVIMGHQHEMFLYQGTNQHYDSYFDSDLEQTANMWAELISHRHRELTKKVPLMLSIFVPNKATCLPLLFPQPLPRGGTVVGKSIKRLLADDPGVLFPLQDPSISSDAMAGAWLRTDSHWSPSGCLIAVNEILKKMALPLVQYQIATNQVEFRGDLSQKWQGRSMVEERLDLHSPELESLVPELEYDNSEKLSEHFGRHVRWANKKAKYPINITIVGDSFSGPGESSRELTWWLSRLFQSVTFLHMALIPTDVVDTTSCDFLIFEITERFLPQVPRDDLTYAQLQKLILENHD
jgi:hypothetical protein